MVSLSVSSHSRSSSLFSLASSASSFTALPPSPKTLLDEKLPTQEKQSTPRQQSVLRWKSQFLSSAFTHKNSTYIKFTAFPPNDCTSHLSGFDHLSWKTAISLLHNDEQATSLSIFASPESTVDPVDEIPMPSNLPEELIYLLRRDDDWQFYTIFEPAPVLISISSLTAVYKHYVAARNLQNGVERYIFGPGGLCLHSVCQVVDVGRPRPDFVLPETLYLEETTEVLCSMLLKWWYRSSIMRRTQEAHEQFRSSWDMAMTREWAILRRMRDTDLLLQA